jgi:hypothetical protein
MWNPFRPKPADDYSHWYSFIQNFNTSTKEFYADVEKELEVRQVPGLEIRQVDFAEGGLLSAKRKYLPKRAFGAGARRARKIAPCCCQRIRRVRRHRAEVCAKDRAGGWRQTEGPLIFERFPAMPREPNSTSSSRFPLSRHLFLPLPPAKTAPKSISLLPSPLEPLVFQERLFFFVSRK